ncbi:hypothetical protein A2W24_04255 [Microgenomates group bacterium RBG_16_45_19]|nr:MAG: hypothetical protein A2W24_04255 [Microgenomates group bacterium RBG_16_45_19]
MITTTAFFNDTETATGNTFRAGTLDLQIDNSSYYNGQFNPATSWALRDLTVEKFFDFIDLKPGDHGEDTISLHIKDNPAYACVNFRQTENSDHGFSEPEDMMDGQVNQSDGTPTGDLGRRIVIKFWLDDGDNVLEMNEQPFDHLTGTLDSLFTKTAAIADATSQPLEPNRTYHIAKFWCYGSPRVVMIYRQDGLGLTQLIGGNGPDRRPNFICDGSVIDNRGQTDIFKGDISFYAVQARNNPNFICSPSLFPSPTSAPL